MPQYQLIDAQTPAGKRTLDRLIALRQKLDTEVPAKNLEETLLLGTWNIREFDSPSFGLRTDESLFYIAEIISRFDLVAVQEIRKNIKPLERLMEILGPRWAYMFTDVTEGSKGNKERTAFIYDTRKVKFGGLAGELVLPPVKEKDADGKKIEKNISQAARTPFVVGFQSGWTSFMLTTVHILYGSSKADDPERIAEIQRIAEFLKKRSEEKTVWSRNLILLGDFNIFDTDDETLLALTDAGFIIPPEIRSLPSNIQQNKHYDQIAFRVREDRFERTGHAGVINFFDAVYRVEDEQAYVGEMGESYLKNSRGEERTPEQASRYYQTYWRTHQMSDHLPMWVEIKINFADQYLGQKLKSASGGEFEEITKSSDFSRNIFGRLKQIVDWSEQDKSGADFRGYKLRKANLSEAILKQCDFTEANLAKADLSHAILTGAIFQEANLSEANLRGANLFEADMRGANLSRADLQYCELSDVLWEGANLTGAIFSENQRAHINEAGIDIGELVFV